MPVPNTQTISLTSPSMEPLGGDNQEEAFNAEKRRRLAEYLAQVNAPIERARQDALSDDSSQSLPTDLIQKFLPQGSNIASSYKGGSGPAPGSFRGAQEAGIGSTPVGSEGVGMSNWAGGATPLLYAYLIGKGKMMENEALRKDPNDFAGNFGLATLLPSMSQISKDPLGMGLPTAAGVPFITPFTGSKKAKQTAPEWASLWNGFGL